MNQYSSNFWLACLSMFFFMMSFNLILPELNDFITSLGGASYKGLILLVFTVSAAISRPFSGKMADISGRKLTMYVGMVVAFTASILYPLSQSVFFFLLLRFVHGFSAGYTPTGATALVTDLIPEEKRGVGMGLWGTFISLGIGVGQSLSYPIVAFLGMDGLFFTSAFLTLISLLFLHKVQETLENKSTFRWNQFRIGIHDVFEKTVLPSAIVMYLSAISSGIIFVLVSDIAKKLEIANKGWFFLFYVCSTIILRLFTSKLSDVIGRRQTLIIGMIILIISMYLIGKAETVTEFTLGAVIFGLATGVSSPTLFAWTADLSAFDRRGVGAGTQFIALELGIMTGSGATLLLYTNQNSGIYHSFLFGVLCAILALIYLIWHLMTQTKKR